MSLCLSVLKESMAEWVQFPYRQASVNSSASTLDSSFKTFVYTNKDFEYTNKGFECTFKAFVLRFLTSVTKVSCLQWGGKSQVSQS